MKEGNRMEEKDLVENKMTDVKEEVKEKTTPKTKKVETGSSNEDIYKLIIDVTDRLIEIKDPNSFLFAQLGKQQKLVLCNYLLAYCYQKGLGCTVNLKESERIYQQCFESIHMLAETGDSKAQLYMGFYYLKGLGGVEIDEEEAFDYFAQSRMQGNTRAQNQLFKFAERMSFGKHDRWAQEKGQKFAEKAMEIESEYLSLDNPPEDPQVDFIEALEKIASKNLVLAQMLLASWYEKGIYTETNLEKAFFWYQKASETNPDAMFYLAKAYLDGKGCTKDSANSFSYCEKAANQGIVEAMNLLGDLYYDGIGCEQNYDLSYEWHKKAADKGSLDAKFKLGIHYYNAEGCKKDTKESLKWYEEAAKEGYGIAECKLGSCFQGVFGIEKDEKKSLYWYTRAALHQEEDAIEKVGITKDYQIVDFEKAIKWLSLSAEKENYDAEYALGKVYEQEGENQDLDKALDWYQKGAEHGEENCLRRLGATENKGYAKDTARFVFWYERSMNGTNPFAKMRLGDCFLYGTGTEQSNEKALMWYDQAASNGCALASYQLGNFYFKHDKLVEKDDSKAVYYYDLAAKEHFVPAQMAIASCYETAFGCEKDLNQAVYWYQQAASLKNYDAEKKLTKFKKNKDGNWVKKLF